jgi:hypothetical protein
MKLNLKREEAILIAYSWASEQETAIDLHGGYIGELYVVRDRIVSFINCNGEKYDGPRISIMSKDNALKEAKEILSWNYEYFDDSGKINYTEIELFECYGQDVKSLADYLMCADGEENEDYSAGDSYKENSPAHNGFYGNKK